MLKVFKVSMFIIVLKVLKDNALAGYRKFLVVFVGWKEIIDGVGVSGS